MAILPPSASFAAAAQGPASLRAASIRAASTSPNPGSQSSRDSWSDSSWGDVEADKNAKDTTGRNVPAQDAGSLASVTTAIGARAVWAQRDAAKTAITGRGVTVALLDTGVSNDVPGLTDAGKVVYGPDLSLEANSAALRGRDTFGHGTHLASIIAARDAVTVKAKTWQPRPADVSVQLGVAPDARVLAVKVATTDGSTDVSQVIAGLDWVTQHRNDNGMRVRVVNLSYGTNSDQSYLRDPLAAAAENAWKHGIVVVVSGGNDGPTATRLDDPAIDPYVIAVGASDSQAQVTGWRAPIVASFSSRGSTARHVDLLAPGTSIAGLRNPGSFIDREHPEGRIAGDTTGRLFRGSGTSQAAAVVSGSVALLLQAFPDLTPDQIKAALVGSARGIAGSVLDKGAGELDVNAALQVARTIAAQSASGLSWNAQSYSAATGLGSLEAARGGSNLVDPDTGKVLAGEIDVQSQPWNGADWHAAAVSGASWSGGRWNGARWTGDDWAGASWTNARWDGARWTGARWTTADWDGARWTGARWTGARWTGARWTGMSWL